ncbi:MAG: AbrB/MazE/SpoVT family DNA-binding domain-containing protein [Vulcanimicrobiota bacterium]
MALVRAFVKVDDNRTVTLPLSVARELQLDTGTVVELKVHGARKSTYVTMHKRKMVR